MPCCQTRAHLVAPRPPAPPKNGWSKLQELVLGSARAQSAPSPPGASSPRHHDPAVDHPSAGGRRARRATSWVASASAGSRPSRCARSRRNLRRAGPAVERQAGTAARPSASSSTDLWKPVVAGAQHETGRLGVTRSATLPALPGNTSALLQLGPTRKAVRARGEPLVDTVITRRRSEAQGSPSASWEVVRAARFRAKAPTAGRSPFDGIWFPPPATTGQAGIEASRRVEAGLEARQPASPPHWAAGRRLRGQPLPPQPGGDRLGLETKGAGAALGRRAARQTASQGAAVVAGG